MLTCGSVKSLLSRHTYPVALAARLITVILDLSPVVRAKDDIALAYKNRVYA